MRQSPEYRPVRSAADPNLTVLPPISAPIDEGILIPRPPPNRWNRLLVAGGLLLAAGAVLSYAFVHATAFR